MEKGLLKILNKIQYSRIHQIYYIYAVKGYEEVGKVKPRSLNINVSEFLSFLKSENWKKFELSKKEEKEIIEFLEKPNISYLTSLLTKLTPQVSKEKFDSIFKEETDDNIPKELFQDNPKKQKIASKIITDNNNYKWKSDKVKEFLRNEFTESEILHVMNLNDHTQVNMSYILKIKEDLLKK